MGTSQDDVPPGDLLVPPPPSSPAPPSDDSTLGDEQDPLEVLSEHESKLLDHSTSLLDQEYDYQRYLITHYSQIRDQTRLPSYSPKQTIDIRDVDGDNSGRHARPSWSGLYKKKRRSSFVPPRIYTGMDDGAMREKGYPASTNNAYAYHYTHRRRPLIDLIPNQWPTAVSSPASPTAPSFSQLISAPKFRRYIIIILLVIVLPWTSWRWFGRPRWEEYRLLNSALEESLRPGSTWYGLNMRPAFLDMVQVQTLNSSQLPQGAGEKRLIFVGNVHGCYDERKSYDLGQLLHGWPVIVAKL